MYSFVPVSIILSMIKQNLPLAQVIVLVLAALFSNGDNIRFFWWLIFFEFLCFGLYVLYNRYENGPAETVESFRRKEALRIAKIFLSPYTDIWSNLKLSNKYCYLKLGSTPYEIHAVEKVMPYREFFISESKVHSYEELWNMFCKSFTHNVTYKGLVELSGTFKAVVTETVSPSTEYYSEYQHPTRTEGEFAVKPIDGNLDTRKMRTEPLYKTNIHEQQKLDINNCSEIELTELPGISIVMAKKAVRKREEIGGFKNIDDFMLYLKLKPHMQRQLMDKIVANKKKGRIVEQRSSERQIDF